LVLRREPALLVRLLAERLDDTVPLHVLVEHRVEPPDALLHPPAGDPQLLGEVAERQPRDGEQDDGEDREDPIHVDRDADEPDEPRHVLEERREGVGHRPADEVHVGRDAGHDLARALAVEESEVEALHVSRELVPEVRHDALADPVGQILRGEVEAATERRGEKHADDRERKRLRMLLREDLVEGELHQERDRALDAAEAEHGEDREHAARPDIRAEIAEEPAILLHPAFPPSISTAIVAARPAAPPRPRRRRTSRRSSTIAARRAGLARISAAAAAIAGPVTCPWRSSGTTSCPATMFGMP